ncbi:hypothetical protein [Methylobacterium soli]|uniref:hypothetical protein n=1 Tax=Methylobacterium soli TaxID=553447 RepID=UPI00177FDD1F|nr:hypothetical protein [Methylobacterium soli]GJE41852.1 hypothetical protein AEGHOMDF_1021 [Methylobacterium soli]
MTAAHPFRRLLALVALLVPTAILPCREAVSRGETTIQHDAAAEVVFRHYL